MMSIISTKLILDSLTHYEALGYKLIDVPQCVDIDVSAYTKPEQCKDIYHNGCKVYVASAEQSFIQLHKEGKLPNGKYVAVTPCCRDESTLDDLHYSSFLKVEVIHVGIANLYHVMLDAMRFMHKYLDITYTETREGTDTMDVVHNYTNTEVGSYGVRKMMDGTIYTYGTGLAEPRFSFCMAKEKAIKEKKNG